MTRRDIVSGMRAVTAAVIVLACCGAAVAQEGTPKGGLEGIGGEGAYEELAARFSVLEKLFGRLSDPEAARRLVETLAAHDPKGFGDLVGDLELPLGGRCWWAAEIVLKSLDLEAPSVTECWVREDLTYFERLLYARIAAKYGVTLVTVQEDLGFHVVGEHVVVPPGPLLDELKAYGLVHCEQEPGQLLSLRPMVGKPFHFCLGDPR